MCLSGKYLREIFNFSFKTCNQLLHLHIIKYLIDIDFNEIDTYKYNN